NDSQFVFCSGLHLFRKRIPDLMRADIRGAARALTTPHSCVALRESNLRRSFVRVLTLALSLSLPLSLAAQTQPAPAKSEVVQYRATSDNVKYVFGVAPPVARLHPGNILEANSLDCFGNAIKKPGDTLALTKGDNPLTGPFFIDGAEPGDTLVVHILDLQVDSNQGIGAFAPGFGALNETNYTPMLHSPLPEKIWFYPIDHASSTATFQALDTNYKVKI